MLALQTRPAYLAGFDYGAVEQIEVEKFARQALGLVSKTIPVTSANAYAAKLDALAAIADMAGRDREARKLREEAARLRALAPAGRASDGGYKTGEATSGSAARPVAAPDVAADIDTASSTGLGLGGWVAALVVTAGLAGGAYYAAKKWGK